MARHPAALALTLAVLAATPSAALAAGAPDPLGSPPPSATPCKGQLSGTCATVRETTDGSGLSVLTVYAPSSTTIRAIDVWTGTPVTKARPKGACKGLSKRSMPQYQIGDMYIERCRITIKPKRSATVCLAGLSRLPSLNAGVTYGIAVYGGDAGGGAAYGLPPTTRCPRSVTAKR